VKSRLSYSYSSYLSYVNKSHSQRPAVVLLTFKALCGLAPSYLTSILTVERHSRVLRLADCLQLVAPRVGFSVAAARLWNGLPVELKSCTDLVVFKRLLKTFLFRQASLLSHNISHILYSALSGRRCWILRFRNLIIYIYISRRPTRSCLKIYCPLCVFLSFPFVQKILWSNCEILLTLLRFLMWIQLVIL
jgi:hypothetical protein